MCIRDRILCVLLLSSALLPPLGVMLALAVVLAVVAWLQWRFLLRIYARAQIAIKETLESHELGQAESEADALPTSLLEAAHLDSVRLAKGSPAAGQAIGALELRTNTDVSTSGSSATANASSTPARGRRCMRGIYCCCSGKTPSYPRPRPSWHPPKRTEGVIDLCRPLGLVDFFTRSPGR